MVLRRAPPPDAVLADVSDDDHGACLDEQPPTPPPVHGWRPWWVLGTPGQIVWFGVLGCIWAFIAIGNLVTRHRPQDYWFAGVITLLSAVLIVNIVAWFTRRDVIHGGGDPTKQPQPGSPPSGWAWTPWPWRADGFCSSPPGLQRPV